MITFNEQAVYEKYKVLVDQIAAAVPGTLFAIAGGAIRDTLMDRPVKDIDILVEGSELLDDQQIAGFEAVFGTTFKRYNTGKREEYVEPKRRSFPVAIYQSTTGVDIIVVRDIGLHVDDFPDDISMAYIDTLGLSIRDAFIAAHEKQMFSYRSSAGPERLERLLAKYPGYSVGLREGL